MRSSILKSFLLIVEISIVFMSTSSILIVPLTPSTMPSKALKMLVFPDPVRPTMAMCSPPETLIERPLSAASFELGYLSTTLIISRAPKDGQDWIRGSFFPFPSPREYVNFGTDEPITKSELITVL